MTNLASTTMKWISPVPGLGTWITRFSFEETGRTVGAVLDALGLIAAPAPAASAVGATATSSAAAISLRATFKKPLREMSSALPLLLVDPCSWDRSEAPLAFWSPTSASVLAALRTIRRHSPIRMST